MAQERQGHPRARCCSGLYDDRGVLHQVGVTSPLRWIRRKQLADGAGAACGERARRTSVARGDDGGGARHRANAGRAEPLERGQGSVVGARADRAGVRRVKDDHMQGAGFRHATRSLTLATGQATERLPLRPARGHGRLRAREGVWCRFTPRVLAEEHPTSRPDPALPPQDAARRDVLEIDPNTRPGAEASAHRHRPGRRRGGAVLRRLRMTSLPTVEPRECIRLPLCARQSSTSDAASPCARRDGWARVGSPGVLAIVRRPRSHPPAVALVPCGELEERVERTDDD